MISPAQASLRGKIGAYRLHALHDSRVTTAAARLASASQLDRRLLAEVDPDGTLDPAARARRLEYARKALWGGKTPSVCGAGGGCHG